MAMNKHGNLKCSACGSYAIKLSVYYDGADWNSEKGEGSGFKYGIDLYCDDCGRAYPVCRLKDEFAVCALADVKARGEDYGIERPFQKEQNDVAKNDVE